MSTRSAEIVVWSNAEVLRTPIRPHSADELNWQNILEISKIFNVRRLVLDETFVIYSLRDERPRP